MMLTFRRINDQMAVAVFTQCTPPAVIHQPQRKYRRLLLDKHIAGCCAQIKPVFFQARDTHDV